jgi:hypothetical protein
MVGLYLYRPAPGTLLLLLQLQLQLRKLLLRLILLLLLRAPTPPCPLSGELKYRKRLPCFGGRSSGLICGAVAQKTQPAMSRR